MSYTALDDSFESVKDEKLNQVIPWKPQWLWTCHPKRLRTFYKEKLSKRKASCVAQTRCSSAYSSLNLKDCRVPAGLCCSVMTNISLLLLFNPNIFAAGGPLEKPNTHGSVWQIDNAQSCQPISNLSRKIIWTIHFFILKETLRVFGLFIFLFFYFSDLELGSTQVSAWERERETGKLVKLHF